MTQFTGNNKFNATNLWAFYFPYNTSLWPKFVCTRFHKMHRAYNLRYITLQCAVSLQYTAAAKRPANHFTKCIVQNIL